jgi:hypothetical protein
MLTTDSLEPPNGLAPAALPPLVATDLQDHLMVACNDLDRLQRLLSDAGESLIVHYHGADSALKELPRYLTAAANGEASAEGALAFVQLALDHLRGAITALQFQDMSTQLVEHTQRRLRSCADRLAYDTLADDEDGAAVVTAAPERPNPVTQDEMDAGSIELF